MVVPLFDTLPRLTLGTLNMALFAMLLHVVMGLNVALWGRCWLEDDGVINWPHELVPLFGSNKNN